MEKIIDVQTELPYISPAGNVLSKKAISPLKALPELPTAGVIGKHLSDWKTAAAAGIRAGAAHHTVMSSALHASHLLDFAEIADMRLCPEIKKPPCQQVADVCGFFRLQLR